MKKPVHSHPHKRVPSTTPTCGTCYFGHEAGEALVCFGAVHALVMPDKDGKPQAVTMRVGVKPTDFACAVFKPKAGEHRRGK